MWDQDLIQSPDSVKWVRLGAGYTQMECSYECGIDSAAIVNAERDFPLKPLDTNEWNTMKRICYKRIFDGLIV